KNFSETNPKPIELIGLKHINLKAASEKIRKELEKIADDKSAIDTAKNIQELNDTAFVHLHNHSQFSILQSTSSTRDLIQAAINDKMPAVALTDSGNMMGTFHFVQAIISHNKALKEAFEKEE